MTRRRAIWSVAAGLALSVVIDVAVAWLADQFEDHLFDG